MQRRNLIIIGVALLLGLVAVYLANAYFSGIEEREQRIAEQQKLARIVVASQPLGFGTPLATSNVKVVNWPANSVPQGAFRSMEDALRDGRVALRPILAGEPILAERVSGKDGRASISYELPEGMRAVSIPVSAVSAVSGFVRPGDVVDVLLTRQLPGSEGDEKLTDVLLPNVRVIAIDQVANEKDTKPKVGKTAVVMVDQTGAQVLTLAREVGSLSLALRNIENEEFDEVRFAGARKFVSTRDLNLSRPRVRSQPQPAPAAPVQVAAAGPRPVPPRVGGPTMTIVRGTQPTNYEVRYNVGW